MELLLTRFRYTPQSTIGQIEIDGQFECFTLEDAVREGGKVWGKTAIPAGRYKIEITWSPRFQKYLPLLVDVPGFSGIRIHSGNKAADTEGCILVGRTYRDDWIGESRVAYKRLYARLSMAHNRRERIEIEIKNQR